MLTISTDGDPTLPAALAQFYSPPAIAPAAPEDGLISFLRASVSNPLSSVPAAAYENDAAVVSVLGTRIGSICAPKLLEEILIKRPQDFPKSEVDERVLKPAFGTSLLVAEGDDWRWKRRLAAPYFSPAALAKTFPSMVEPFEALARDWSISQQPTTLDVSEAMTKATLEVIGKTLFTDPDPGTMTEISDAIVDYLSPISWTILFASLKLPAWIPHPGISRIHRGKRQMRVAVRNLIQQHRNAPTPYRDICSDLMHAEDPETGRPLSDVDLVDMLLTLVAAGHETSANALTWALYCLAQQPDLQAELRDEVRTIVGDRAIAAIDLPKLEKIEAFAKETMRLFPPAPLIARHTTKPETFGQYQFAPGTTLFIPIYAIHRHRKLWHEPDRFDLTRFLGESGRRIPRTAYMPFGAGPRICIGGTFAMMEITGALGAILRSVSFSADPATRCEPIQRITLRPKDGMHLRVASN